MSYLDSGVYYGDSNRDTLEKKSTQSLDEKTRKPMSVPTRLGQNKSSPILARQNAVGELGRKHAQISPRRSNESEIPKSPRSPRLNRVWNALGSGRTKSSESSLSSKKEPKSSLKPTAFSVGSPSPTLPVSGCSLDVPSSCRSLSASSCSNQGSLDDPPLPGLSASCKSAEFLNEDDAIGPLPGLVSKAPLMRSKSAESVEEQHGPTRKISQPVRF